MFLQFLLLHANYCKKHHSNMFYCTGHKLAQCFPEWRSVPHIGSQDNQSDLGCSKNEALPLKTLDQRLIDVTHKLLWFWLQNLWRRVTWWPLYFHKKNVVMMNISPFYKEIPKRHLEEGPHSACFALDALNESNSVGCQIDITPISTFTEQIVCCFINKSLY